MKRLHAAGTILIQVFSLALATGAAASPESLTKVEVERLSLLATSGRSLDARSIEEGLGMSAAAYVKKLLGTRQAAEAATNALFPEDRVIRADLGDVLEVLSSAEVQGQRVFYLRDSCALSDTEQVHPWWDLASTIRVCSDSYRPDRIREPKTGVYCGSVLLGLKDTAGRGNPGPTGAEFCGCGPNLMLCARDAAHHKEVMQSLAAELSDTIADNVERDLPLSQIFTANASVRDLNAEFLYQRWRVINSGGAFRLQDWKEKALRPREDLVPELHAGILTTHFMIHGDVAAPRERIRRFSSMLWCIEPKSLNVSTETVLNLKGNFRREAASVNALMTKVGCEGCHARMDKALSFFTSFGSEEESFDFRLADVHTGTASVHIENLKDFRGMARATPGNFAALAVAQPEFGQCMVRRVAEHVFGNEVSAADTAALAAEYRRHGTYKALLQVALERYASRMADPRPTEVATRRVPNFVGQTHGGLVPAPLRDLLSEDCSWCHDQHSDLPTLDGARLDRDLVNRMIFQVSMGYMPKGEEISKEHKDAILGGLIGIVSSNAVAQERAFNYLNGSWVEAPTYRSEAMSAWIYAGAAGQTESAMSAGQRLGLLNSEPLTKITRTRLKYTSGVAVLVALEALSACKRLGNTGEMLAACISRSTRVEGLVDVIPPEESMARKP